MLESLRQPVIFAHRGASAHFPENTLTAFRKALELGAEGIELDAKLSKDGEIMVIHDQTVDRTTDGRGKVNELTRSEMQRLDSGRKKAPEFEGEYVPALEEVFAEVGGKIFINVELTNYASPKDELVEKTASLVKRYGLIDWVMFSSFNPFNVQKIRRLLPECPSAILALPGSAGILSRSFAGRWFSPNILHPFLDDVSEKMVHREHKSGRRVHVWTVNADKDMQRLFRWRVDGIITDDPALARQIRGEL